MPNRIFFTLEQVFKSLKEAPSYEGRRLFLEKIIGDDLWSYSFQPKDYGVFYYGKILNLLSDSDQLSLLQQGYKAVPSLSTLDTFKRIYNQLSSSNKLELLKMQIANPNQLVCKELGQYLLKYTSKDDLYYALIAAVVDTLPPIKTPTQLVDNWPHFIEDIYNEQRLAFLNETITFKRLTNEILQNLNDFFLFYRGTNNPHLYDALKEFVFSKITNFDELLLVMKELRFHSISELFTPRIYAMITTFAQFEQFFHARNTYRIGKSEEALLNLLSKLIKSEYNLSVACNVLVDPLAIETLITKLVAEENIVINTFYDFMRMLKAIPPFRPWTVETMFQQTRADIRGQQALITALKSKLPALIQTMDELSQANALFGNDDEGKRLLLSYVGDRLPTTSYRI